MSTVTSDADGRLTTTPPFTAADNASTAAASGWLLYHFTCHSSNKDAHHASFTIGVVY